MSTTETTPEVHVPITLTFTLVPSRDPKESDHVTLVNEELGLEFRYYAPTCRDLDYMTRDLAAKIPAILAGRHKAALIQVNDYEGYMKLNQERNELAVYLLKYHPQEWESGRFSSPEKCAIHFMEKERNRFWNRLKIAMLSGRKKGPSNGKH